ncbi:MAG: 16S rRNA (guanine(966)-N(2))-methyltransferase RsmD [Clostridiales bacterium]|nr:16S rRNA (guanine(966)-N(2))-methyltransferase RsmD [Clostridiales bacterium]
MAVRILGGTHRSRLITTPRGVDTRPTRSMVREAVFNILQGQLAGSRVLDLFAGSGAMGLEALSRGASLAVFCDRQQAARQAISENLRRLQLADAAQLLQADWQQAIRQLQARKQQFHLIFLDPPYKMDAEPVLAALVAADLLDRDGHIILEQSTQTTPGLPDALEIQQNRRYGQTRLYIITRKGEPA